MIDKDGKRTAVFTTAFFILFFSVIVFPAVNSVGAPKMQPSHLDKSKNPWGCSGCHQGHGKKGTPMLRSSRQDICFSCHSPSGRGLRVTQDIYSVFNKRYKHPVIETSAYHSDGEQLPEKSASARRHVGCMDCHSVHETQPGLTWENVWGYSRERRAKMVSEEYELCYKCHSDSANLPPSENNKREEFSVNNASYHPVELRGRNTRLHSLLPPYNVSSRISCSDCHGNDDAYGPKGPHGSDHEFLLKANYIMTETAETPNAYELCYSCHDRRSILNNDSFKRHKEHIVYQHAPCASCHTPHGSRINQHLIEFDQKFVDLVPMPSYVPSNSGKPLCFLKCHIGGRDYQHNNAFYASKRWP